jgi:hypothetical protein
MVPPRTPLLTQHYKRSSSKLASLSSRLNLTPYGTVSSFHTPASSFSDSYEPYEFVHSSLLPSRVITLAFVLPALTPAHIPPLALGITDIKLDCAYYHASTIRYDQFHSTAVTRYGNNSDRGAMVCSSGDSMVWQWQRPRHDGMVAAVAG